MNIGDKKGRYELMYLKKLLMAAVTAVIVGIGIASPSAVMAAPQVMADGGIFDAEYYAEFLINLGDNFGLDYDNCKLILDCENIKTDEEVCRKVLNNVYLNGKYAKR